MSIERAVPEIVISHPLGLIPYHLNLSLPEVDWMNTGYVINDWEKYSFLFADKRKYVYN
ncbi:hypothetical protein [Thermoactinomyces mirandus]|uniref:Uncharacterized protein n=1 Tax=Thermoactinomyces mirandus TaxID=2756294 RepID=A0A7W1XUD8_9BACL|nr:hypothetical protein [Thermoactinomyces mirandus]MBA4603477.1 hypothetical protein [Thermoactinomyces mirandus]